MAQIDRREFLADLDAMQESRVREKLMLGHYAGWKEKCVERWLSERVARREDEQARRQQLSTERVAFWTRGRAVIAVLGIVFAAAAEYLFLKG